MELKKILINYTVGTPVPEFVEVPQGKYWLIVGVVKMPKTPYPVLVIKSVSGDNTIIEEIVEGRSGVNISRPYFAISGDVFTLDIDEGTADSTWAITYYEINN